MYLVDTDIMIDRCVLPLSRLGSMVRAFFQIFAIFGVRKRRWGCEF